MNLSEKTLVVLDSLFMGQQIEIEMCEGIKHKIVLIDKQLRIILLRTTRDGKEVNEEVYLSCDIPLNSFIQACDNLSDDNVVTIAVNSALTKLNKKRLIKENQVMKKSLFYFVIEEERSAYVMSANSKKEMEQYLVLMHNWYCSFDKESKAKKFNETNVFISKQTKNFEEVRDETDGLESEDIVSAESMISSFMKEANIDNYKDLLKYSLTFNLEN